MKTVLFVIDSVEVLEHVSSSLVIHCLMEQTYTDGGPGRHSFDQDANLLFRCLCQGEHRSFITNLKGS
jgi:hypothetical protein